ncbi:hypothetical protein KW787_01470 [Candidatus Pacearchaeota archaeon]|nr:hypothetical protein [Candidatus Pacearchaeota archaeon]
MIVDSGRGLKEVFKNGKNIFSAIIIAFLFYSFNILISDSKNIASLFPHLSFGGDIVLVFNLIVGASLNTLSFYTMIIISILTGMLITILWYNYKKIRRLEGKGGIAGSIGLFLGLLAPACASCGIGLAAILGLGTVLAVLPFKGSEVSFVAIVLLIYSLLIVSSAVAESCDINSNRIKLKLERKKR